MNKEFRIFFSWQSDLDPNKTRAFIRECIEKSKDLPGISVILDEDTRELPGSPDIVQTIFAKIDNCDLFIADVSIVGKYSNTDHVPNPNVMLELGYALKTVGEDRVCCLINTEFGKVEELPFDLRQRRITQFNTKNRGKEIEKIVGIIKKQISELSQKPFSKKGYPYHIIGSYVDGRIESRLIPLDVVARYQMQRRILRDEAKAKFNEISSICIDKDNKDGSSTRDIYKRITHPIRIDPAEVKQKIQKYLDIELKDEFFDFYAFDYGEDIYGGYVCSGDENVKLKYKSFFELYSQLEMVRFFDDYISGLGSAKVIALAIQNISDTKDSNISIKINVVKGIPKSAGILEFNRDLREKLEGISDLQFLENLFELPPELNYEFNPFQFGILDTTDKYENEIKKYISRPEEGLGKVYKFDIKDLRPNEMMWIGLPMLIEPQSDAIEILYSIISDNTTGDLEGILHI